MQCGSLCIVWLALCCLHTASETLNTSDDQEVDITRRTRHIDDGLALSREIFKNITKQLRENIHREGTTDKNDQLLQRKIEDTQRYSPYQKYHDHVQHWGPYFEGDIGQETPGFMQVTTHVGAEALLNCRVGMLKDKTVMWLRRTADSAHLLTVGDSPYAGDNRIAVKFQYPNNWRLSINPVRRSDEGLYMCQISTHPPRAILANFTVLPPVLTINGDQTHETKDRFYKAGSAIKLSCIISEDYIASLPIVISTTTQLPRTTTPVTTTRETTKTSTVFNRIDLVLNKSWSVETTTFTSTVRISSSTRNVAETQTTLEPILTTRTPVVVNNVYGLIWRKQGVEFFDNVTFRNMSATINVASASQNDSGTYTCLLLNHSQVTINVHVLIGENQAAVHHDTWNKGTLFWKPNFCLFSILILSFTT